MLMDLHAVSGGAVVSLGTMHIRLASIHLTSFRQASKDARVRDLIRKLQQPDEDIEQETETGRLKQKHTDADTEKVCHRPSEVDESCDAIGDASPTSVARRAAPTTIYWTTAPDDQDGKTKQIKTRNQIPKTKYQMNTTWLRFCVAARGKHPTTGRLFAIHFPTTLNP